MYNYPLSLAFSLIGLALIVISYFTKNKGFYLLFQFVGIVFLGLSFLFVENYFTAITTTVGLARTLTVCIYERHDKSAPISMAILFSVLTVAMYFIINWWVLGDTKPLDIINVCSLCLYAFAFRIRNLRIMRYVVIIPILLAVSYNILVASPIFTLLAYISELTANLIAILRYDLIPRYKESRTLSTKRTI